MSSVVYNPCHKLVAKRQNKIQLFVVSSSSDFKVFFLQVCCKKILIQGGGGSEKGIFSLNDSFATIYVKGCLNSQKKKKGVCGRRGRGGVQKREFPSQIIVLPQFMGSLVDKVL